MNVKAPDPKKLQALIDMACGWQPITTAPQDCDTVVDIYARHRKSGIGWREPDCVRSRLNDCWVNRDGRWFTGKTYLKNGEECYDPACTDEESVVATHWMTCPLPPSPPKTAH